MTTLSSPPQRHTTYRRASAAAMGLIVVAGMVFCTMDATAAQPRHKSHDFKQQVEQLEEQWRTAQLADDVATMDKLLSDDYIGISLNGEVNTKSQQLDRLRSRRVTLTRLDLSEMKVKLIGSIAIVTSRALVEGNSDGASVKGLYRYTRVYQHVPSGAWKITSFEATRIPQALPRNGQALPSASPDTPQHPNMMN